MIPDREELKLLDLSADPTEWPQIKVIQESGIPVWKYIPEVTAEDHIPRTQKGLPYCMYKQPGRPKASESSAPPPADDASAEEVSRYKITERLRLKDSAIDVDPIVQIARSDVDSSAILQMSIIALAEEAAALKYDRATAERSGEMGSSYSMKRIKALESLVSKWTDRKRMLDATSVDLDSHAFGVVFKLIVQSFTEALRTSEVDQETIDTVISNFVNVINNDEWKSEAKSQMSNLGK